MQNCLELRFWAKVVVLSWFCFLIPIYSTDIATKRCAAHGEMTEHSEIEDVYDNPQ